MPLAAVRMPVANHLTSKYHTQHSEAHNSRIPRAPAAFVPGIAQRNSCYCRYRHSLRRDANAPRRCLGAVRAAGTAAKGLALDGELDVALAARAYARSNTLP